MAEKPIQAGPVKVVDIEAEIKKNAKEGVKGASAGLNLAKKADIETFINRVANMMIATHAAAHDHGLQEGLAKAKEGEESIRNHERHIIAHGVVDRVEAGGPFADVHRAIGWDIEHNLLTREDAPDA